LLKGLGERKVRKSVRYSVCGGVKGFAYGGLEIILNPNNSNEGSTGKVYNDLEKDIQGVRKILLDKINKSKRWKE